MLWPLPSSCPPVSHECLLLSQGPGTHSLQGPAPGSEEQGRALRTDRSGTDTGRHWREACGKEGVRGGLLGWEPSLTPDSGVGAVIGCWGILPMSGI